MIISGGDFAAAGNKMQKEAGIQDSADLMLADMLKAGSIKKSVTLEEIAKSYNIPADVFLAEIKRLNAFVDKKKDSDFGCMIFPEAKPT